MRDVVKVVLWSLDWSEADLLAAWQGDIDHAKLMLTSERLLSPTEVMSMARLLVFYKQASDFLKTKEK